MHLPPWFWFAAIALTTWGTAAFLQKLSTNLISAESALIWLIAGFLLLEPWLYPGRSMLIYSLRTVAFAVLSGTFNALGLWSLLAAMKSGGKAAIVVPITALYPLAVVIAAPLLLSESITAVQGAGILCGLGAVILLST